VAAAVREGGGGSGGDEPTRERRKKKSRGLPAAMAAAVFDEMQPSEKDSSKACLWSLQFACCH
jgi:hypothetical protein